MQPQNIRLIIVSGLSGSGKSIALHTLEDEGFYCIDNLPAEFVHTLSEKLAEGSSSFGSKVAVSIDIRSLSQIPSTETTFNLASILARLRQGRVETDVVFIEADPATLTRRYSEARRPHPLTYRASTLEQAIEIERDCLEDILMNTNLKINTTNLNHHQLGEVIRSRLCGENKKPSLLIQSFGYNKGLPPESDFVFDVRCLLNPYWEPRLRKMTGCDAEVVRFLESNDASHALFRQILNFVEGWSDLPGKNPRSSLTLSIGCTGGQHRSVYMVECLYAALKKQSRYCLTKHHRELASI